jgi:catechol 2,3-dioxygenase-like lactoylglutathione lyase family enzyme
LTVADGARAVLRERGAEVAVVGHFDSGTFVFVRDNAGNLIEFVQQADMWT